MLGLVDECRFRLQFWFKPHDLAHLPESARIQQLWTCPTLAGSRWNETGTLNPE